MFGGIPPTVKSGVYSRVKSGISSHALSLVALTSVIALILALPSTSSAQATTVGPIEVPFAGTNPCTGEALVGTSRILVIHYPLRLDGSGGVHLTLRVLTHSEATSVGVNPRKHRSNHETGAELNAPSSGTLEATQTINQVLVRQGEDQSSTLPLSSDDDFMLKQTMHMTFNSNGILTADVLNGHETECAGPPLGPAAIVVP